MNRRVDLITVLGSLLLTLSFAGTARCELITFEFSGTVTNVSVLNVLGLANFDFPDIGDPFTGFYTFDSDSPDTADSPTIGAFITVLPGTALGATIGDFQFEGAATNIVTSNNLYETGDWIPSIELTSNPALAQILDRNSFSMVVTRENLFEDPNILPLTPPSLAGAQHLLRMTMDSPFNHSDVPFVTIMASLDSLTIVPEPTSLLLMAIVLIVSVHVKRRQRRMI